MIDRIDDFFNNLDPISAKTYAKIYFNIILDDKELKQGLPFIKSCWKDYLDSNKKELFINQLIVATNQNTANKYLSIMNKIFIMYNLN